MESWVDEAVEGGHARLAGRGAAAGEEGMPGREGEAFAEAAIGAVGGQPAEGAVVLAEQIDAVGDAAAAGGVTLAAQGPQVEVVTGDGRVADPAGPGLAGLVDATHCAAVAESFPLCAGQRA